ncbi:MAG: DnaJ domain-containing protein [Actinomycetota bacterium]
MASGTRARDWAEVDFYAVLGVPADATEDRIARAYRTLAKRLHPDSGATTEDGERFKDIAAAHAVLGDARIRRDYDRVRREMTPIAARPVPTSALRADTRRAGRGLTRRRAWLAVIGGVVTTIAGIGVGALTWNLHADDQAVRDRTIAVDARRIDVNGAAFVEFSTHGGETVRAPEPDREEASGTGTLVGVRYDPDDPTRVVADENRAGRDLTLTIVALKLLVSGPVVTGFGLRRLARH